MSGHLSSLVTPINILNAAINIIHPYKEIHQANYLIHLL